MAHFISQLLNNEIGQGIIQHDTKEALEAFKKHFTVIQAAGGVILNGNQEILMIFRRGKWDLPKGKLDEGEDLQNCAVREVEEETGVAAIITQPLCISYHTYFEHGKHILKESHWFLMEVEGVPALQPQTEEDIEKCEWVKKDKLSAYFQNIHPSIVDVLNRMNKFV